MVKIDERQSRVNALCGKMNETYKTNLMKTNDRDVIMHRIPTRSFMLNYACSGGIPVGRISMFYGPSSTGKTFTALDCVGQAQKYCSKCWTPKAGIYDPIQKKYIKEGCECGENRETQIAYYDIENSWDEEWSRNAAKIDTTRESLHFSNPSFTEQCIDTIDALIRSGDIDLIVVDSLAALSPSEEVKKSTEESVVGKQALLVNRAWRVWNSAYAQLENEGKKKPTMIVINQERLKIGVCFPPEQRVLLANGKRERIGTIVNRKMNVEVMSFNEEKGIFEPKKVIGWFKNGFADRMVNFKLKGDSCGYRSIRCTEDHKFLTEQGWKAIKDIEIGEKIGVKEVEYLDNFRKEFTLGCLLGDSQIRYEKFSPRGRLRFLHCSWQGDYCKWKASIFNIEAKTKKNNRVTADTKLTIGYSFLKGIKKEKGVISISDELIDKITTMVVAIWYQDDGNFSGAHAKWGYGKCSIAAKIMEIDTMIKVAKKMEEIGLGKPTIKQGVGFTWNGEESKKFQEKIAQYVHPNMRYKIRHDMPYFNVVVPEYKENTVLHFEKIFQKEYYVSKAKSRMEKCDIEVEDNHNYLVGNGVIAHNCYGDPSTRPGGEGQKYVTSMDVKFKKNKYEFSAKENGIPVWTLIGGKITKNKTATAQMEFEFALAINRFKYHGMDIKKGDILEFKELIKLAELHGVIGKADDGKKFRYKDNEFKKLSDVYESVVYNEFGVEVLKMDIMEALKKSEGMIEMK